MGGFAIGLSTFARIDLGERLPAAELAATNASFVTLYGLRSTIGPAVAGGRIDVLGPPGFVTRDAVVAAGLAGVLGLWAVKNAPTERASGAFCFGTDPPAVSAFRGARWAPPPLP